MTIEQKARQLARNFFDKEKSQDIRALVEVLIKMAKWQRKQMFDGGFDGEVSSYDLDFENFKGYRQLCDETEIPPLKYPHIKRGDDVRIMLIKK